MLKKLKSPESSFILKSLIKVASFAEYTCLLCILRHGCLHKEINVQNRIISVPC